MAEYGEVLELLKGSKVPRRMEWPDNQYARVSPNGLVHIIKGKKILKIGESYSMDQWSEDFNATDWEVIEDPILSKTNKDF